MSTGAMAIVLIVTLLATLLTGLPVAFSLFGLAALFILVLMGPSQLVVTSLAIFSVGTQEIYIAIPLFIFMACVLQNSGMATALYDVMYKWFAGLRGGLAMGTIAMCTLIAAMTGLGATGVVTMGLLAYPEMTKRGYDRSIALGCIPSGGALGPLIPPSTIMIIIAGFGQLSVGRMFMGGVFPGLLMSFLFMVYIAIRCYIQSRLAPALPKEERATWKEKFLSLKGVILPVILIILVLGSIYTGAATPTEAAGVGAFGALICAAIYHQLNLKNLKDAVFSTFKINAMVMWLVVGGSAFASLIGMTGVRHFISQTMLGMDVSPWVIIILMQIIGLIMGMFMDQAAISIITIPIFMPIVQQLGFDPLWFALVYTINMIVGYISPPFGVTLFYTKGIVPADVTMGEIYRSALPYCGIMILVLIISLVWPPLVIWLPSMMIK